jgi:GntR family transcriptional regulator/MocR family aminotransferase
VNVVRSTGLAVQAGSDEPLYKQIFDQIVDRIRTRAFPPGYRLPPTRDLARELSTHRNTVVRAYVDLERAGFVSSVVGRGTFVAAHSTPTPLRVEPARAHSLPWSSLVSSAAKAEPLARAERLKRNFAGRDLVNLTRMQPAPELLPDELFRRCVEHVMRTRGASALGYAPHDGLPRLRELIAEDLARQGVPASADDIVITTGSQQGIDVLARMLINPGDAVLVDSTTYPGALSLFTAAGARLIPVPSDDEGPDPEALRRLARAGAKAFYLMPNCHNPTGRTISAERRRALVAFSHEAGVPLIEDDFGADLHLTEAPPPPALRALDGEVIYMSTFSKKLLPALRTGFLLCPPALRPALSAMRHAMDLGSSLLVQHALAEFLERGYLRAHVARTVPEYRARRDALEAGLRASLPRSWKWQSPERGVVLWLPLPPGLDPELLYEEAFRRGVLVAPSSVYAVEGRAERGVRLAFCFEPIDRLTKGARKLGEAVRALGATRTSEAAAQLMEVV